MLTVVLAACDSQLPAAEPLPVASQAAISASAQAVAPSSAATGTSSAAAAPSAEPAPTVGDITIRNATRVPMKYTVSGGGAASATPRTLAPGAVDRFVKVGELSVEFEKGGAKAENSLSPGKHYAFRYESDDQIGLYHGSHGRTDVEDLAPYLPTPMSVVYKMLEVAKVTKDDILYDIGCGDGRIVIAAAEKHGARGVCLELDPKWQEVFKQNASQAGVEKLVEFRLGDATKTDISAATVVSTYLLPESNELLRPTFEKQLKPGTRIVTHQYEVPGWKEQRFETIKAPEDQHSHWVYLYQR